MKKADFKLVDYKFNRFKIDFAKKKSDDLEVDFKPSGRFMLAKSEYELKFIFSAISSQSKSKFLEIECIAIFRFKDSIKYEEIPDYFYVNSIAILFPYIRAFVSTLTLQANIFPMVLLPTMNLSSLGTSLRQNTTQV